jgi:heat shock protein HtpX
MASLYTQADSNSRKTWLLITGFLVFAIAIGWIFSRALQSDAILYFAIILSVVMSFSSYWFSDKIVLSMTGARLIRKSDNPELYRIVENLCITAGLPVPKVYISNDLQINAFATGRDKNHAVVCVTQGALQRLNKTELEGVLAHELSHIGNKDMLVSTVVVVLAGVVSLLANFFLRLSFFGGLGRRSNRDSDGGGNAQAIFMIAAIAAAILAPIAATLIKLAISRKREYLADASGALLTRYPEGLASALEKIAADSTPMPRASTATSHLYLESPFKGQQAKSWFVNLFSTHPPIEERIKALKDMQL